MGSCQSTAPAANQQRKSADRSDHDMVSFAEEARRKAQISNVFPTWEPSLEQTFEEPPPLDKDEISMTLASAAFTTQPPSYNNDFLEYTRWVLNKVKAVNRIAAKYDSGPSCRMRVVPWQSLEELGRLPKWPVDAALVLDLETLLSSHLEDPDPSDNYRMLLYFFSHSWIHGHYCEVCERHQHCPDRDTAHPDDDLHSKASELKKLGSMSHESGFDAYYWVDFACIDQLSDKHKAIGVHLLPLYTACCGGLTYYDGVERIYERRAWTRLERVLAYAFCVDYTVQRLRGPGMPLLRDMTDEERDHHGVVRLPDGQFELCLALPDAGDMLVEADRNAINRACMIAETFKSVDLGRGTVKKPLKLGQTGQPIEDFCSF